MRKFLSIVLTLFVCASAIAQERPKVALVLSGGGAKGAAHIGVIKVIEEYDIPIDMVVGSSIGAVVGGLYAQGYTGKQLDSLILSQNWRRLILDNDGQKDNYIFKIPFGKGKDNEPLTAFNRGIVAGTNVEALLEGMIPSGHDSIDFNKLPIPFACNALDLKRRQEVVFHSGDLVKAIRASMSVPMVFAPVQMGDMVLMDGGMYNNLPVDIALAMGADIVIAVKLGEKEHEATPEIETILDVSDQWFELYNRPRTEANIAKADIFIGPSKGEYNTMSYSKEAMENLLKMGEEEARAHSEDFFLLHKMLAEKEGKPAGAKLTKDKKPVSPKDIKPVKDYSKKPSVLAVGGYFDTEEIIALRTHIGLNERADKGSSLAVDLKLAYNLLAGASYSYIFSPAMRVNGGYSFRNSAPNIFKQDYIPTFNFVQHTFFADFSAKLSAVDFKAGASFKMFSGDSKYNVFDIYAGVGYDSRDEIYFPNRGFNVSVRGDYFIKYSPSIYVSASVPIALADWFTLIPSLSHRTLFTDESQPFLSNTFGGVQAGRYNDFQIPFIGFNHMQFAGNSLTAIGLDARFNVKSNHYAFLSGGYACDSQKFVDTKNLRSTFGARIGYSYLTPAGPLSVNVNWSNLTGRVGFYMSFGYSL